MNIDVKNRLDEALNSPEAEQSLFDVAERLKSEGRSQLEIYDVFVNYMNWLDEENREAESDVVLEVVERIYGWCPPSYRLFPKTLSNEEIERFRAARQNT